jgi:type IV secretory pathway VirD2 relaxase
MMSDFRDINCRVQRQVLTGHVGNKVGYILVDEINSITSKSNDTDERQHSVCNYSFVKESSDWKITLEHCSSLPDYSINPGDDALYYFHNPLY